jgi:hypothetical protein
MKDIARSARRSPFLAYDRGHGVAVDSSENVYIIGLGEGGRNENLHGGLRNIFLTKYDAEGNKQWIRQIGHGTNDETFIIAVDQSGNIYITGRILKDGADKGEHQDLFIVSYDADGTKRWSRKSGTASAGKAREIDVDRNGDIIINGDSPRDPG